jgi:hypothetical protein
MVRCEWCGGTVDAWSVCPSSITFPECGARPGTPCVRPSGHRAEMHAARVQSAEDVDWSIGLRYNELRAVPLPGFLAEGVEHA